jgi:cellulose synthase/poly-beta-1,6-N-acetylglucosamine synthase-like glycosyltransferase
VVAAGGNIMPINGCTVERGALTRIALPRNTVARFQGIEYIRAFMAGRVGWSQLRALLIISGAFGVFRRQRVLDVGGYLTEAGRYGRDTVGEDMELVVRLKRSLLAARVPHRINYAFNANCWTEVPEDLKVLHRQRDRWQRGLIDILFFHRTMAFNPRYGRTGTIALPYFFVFEMVGPLIELQGYAMVLLAAVLGLLNVQIALLLFLTVILMGVFVSMFSLYVAEMETDHFSTRDVATLITYAVIENFGFRQLTSWWRVSGYMSSLRKPKGWGQMVRKGFAGSDTPAAPAAAGSGSAALPEQRAQSDARTDSMSAR